MAKGIKQYAQQVHTSTYDLKSQLSTLRGSIEKNLGNDELKAFNRTINNSKNEVSKFSTVWSSLNKVVNIGAIYVGAKQLLGVLKDYNTEAVAYAETVNLFNVSMGKGLEGLNQYYEEALDFQEKLEEKLGTNIEESMRYQAIFNSMSKSTGLDAGSSYTISENLTKLGYDLASLYNIDTESAMTKLRAGLAGQTEPLRELGLDITEQSLKPILQELDITDEDGDLRSIRNMSQAEKTVLRYIAVLKQAKIAWGDFARTTSDDEASGGIASVANQLRIFDAQVTSFKRNIGNLWQGILGGILPYVNAVMMVINELLKMLASIFGFEVSNQPVNLSASIGIDSLGDDLGNATDKAKELKNQLMGFDEIHNISLDKNSDSSSGVSGTGVDQRLLDALTGYDNLMDSVSNKATQIRDSILDWLGATDGTFTNLKKVWEVVKSIGSGLLGLKISKSVLDFFKNLGTIKNLNTFQMAFGIGLSITGIMAQYNGTNRLLDGDFSLFSILETLLGTAGGTFGIVNILRSLSSGSGDKIFSLGQSIKIGLGVMLTIQGVQVLSDGIETGDIKKTTIGAVETSLSGFLTLKTLLGNKSIKEEISKLTEAFTTLKGKAKSAISTVISSVSSFGGKIKTAFSGGITGIKDFITSLKNGENGMSSFVKKGTTLVAGLAGITAGSALTYSTMNDLTTGTIGTGEAFVKLGGGLATATASGVVAGSQFGTFGMIVGGVAGFVTSATTALLGYKNGIDSLNIPTTTLTEEIATLTQEVDANRQAHENAVQSIKDTYENQMVEAEYANRLAEQLVGLVDANGKVIDGNKERVNFILGELNSALGTEYELNGNLITKNGEVVESYQELQGSIADTIEAKKKEAEMSAITEAYKESMKEQIQIEKDLKKLKEEQAKAEIEYNNLMAEDLGDWTYTHNENYRQIIQNYTDVTNKLNETRDKYGEITDDVNYYSQRMTDNIIEDTRNLAPEMEKQGQNLANSIENGLSSVDTTNIGKQTVEGVAKGINDNKNSGSLWSALSNLKDVVVNGLKGLFGIHSPSTIMRDLIGKFIPLGIVEGIDEESNSVYSSLDNLYKGIKVRTSDFTIDTKQYVDFGSIAGNITTQSEVAMSDVTDKLANACYNAFVNAMRTQGIKVNIEAKPDKDGIFKEVRAKAEQYIMETGEEPFPSPAI